MMTYERALAEGRELLKSSGIEEYEVDGFLLLSELLGMNRTQYYMKQKDKISAAEYDKYMSAVSRRRNREPVQYITGKAYFMGFEFYVDRNVLIPRMDTEILAVEAERILKENFSGRERTDVLDMCTGTGCILLSLALRNAGAAGVGVDISRGAVEVAERNKRQLQCSSAEFLHSNLFENVRGTYDMIVSNPPYIRTDDIPGLMEEVRTFEPFEALDGLADGMYFYREITKNAVKYLNDGGFLCYEIGFDQADAVIELMKENGFKNCRVVKDLAGLDRVCTGKL